MSTGHVELGVSVVWATESAGARKLYNGGLMFENNDQILQTGARWCGRGRCV